MYHSRSSDTKSKVENHDTGKLRHQWAAGTALIAIGVLVLITQISHSEFMGQVFLLNLGLIFLLWGIVTRSVGFLIPGGILSGIGMGVYLIAGPLSGSGLEGSPGGAAFMLSFALGWALITALSALVCQETHIWPLIPGGIMAFIGVALLIGGPALTVLTWANKVWPFLLIALGAYVLWKQKTISR